MYRLLLCYDLSPSQLDITLKITNHDVKPMPYYAGFHPYFYIPYDSRAHAILRLPEGPRYLYNNQLTQVVGQCTGLKGPVMLSEPILHEALFGITNQCAASITYPEGDQLMIRQRPESTARFRYIQCYAPEEDFVCIEPWMGYPNGLNVAGVPSLLMPGQSDILSLSLSLD